MGSSPGFGSARRDAPPPSRDGGGRPVRTRLRCGCGPWWPLPRRAAQLAGSFFNRHAISRRRPPEGAGARLSPTVGRRFQGLFHSPRRGAFHLSLAVLVRYRSLGVLSLGPWAARLPAGFLVPRGTHAPAPGRGREAGYGALTRCGAPSQALRLPWALLTPRGPGKGLRAAVQPPGRIGSPATERPGFGLLRVRSPLLTESRSISVPRGTEMFQFPRCPPPSRAVPAYDRGGVAPFGNPRISARWRLPGAFRRLPRPSSAPSAKASTVCPHSLSLPYRPSRRQN